MKKTSLLLLSELTRGFAALFEQNKRDLLIGDDSQKGPPGIQTLNWNQ